MSSNNKYQKICLYFPIAVWILILFYIIHTAFSILIPFIAGSIIAYICEPFSQKLMQITKTPKFVVASIITFLIYSLIAVVIWLIAPMVYKQLINIIQIISSINPEQLMVQITSNATLQNLYETDIGKYTIQFAETLRDDVVAAIPSHIRAITGSIVTSTRSLLVIVFNIIFTPLVSFYIIRDATHISNTWNNFLSCIPQKVQLLIQYLHNVAISFIQLQILIIFIFSIYYSLLLSLVGVKNSLFLGIMFGILHAIPYVGFIANLIICIAIAVFQYGFEIQSFILVLGFLLCDILDFTVISPRLAGKKFGLHPLLTIAGILISSSLFGIIGVIFALPLTFMVKDAVKLTIRYYCKYFKVS